MTIRKINSFVEVDNKNWRKENPDSDKHFEECKKEAATFPKDEYGIISQSSIVNKRDYCPCCNGKDFRYLFNKWGFLHRKCEKCSTIYVENVLKDDVLQKFYESSLADEFAFERTKNNNNINYYSQIYKKYLTLIKESFENKKDPISILDVGCGSGLFVRTSVDIDEGDFEIYATEYSDLALKPLTELLGENYFHQQSLESLKQKRMSFSCITLWGVLEHVLDPGEMIKNIRTLLKPNGIILILIPNLNSAAYEILGVNTPTINPREHLNFFNRESLGWLLEHNKFEQFIWGQELPVIDLMWEFIPVNKLLKDSIIKADKSYYHIYLARKVD